ncbi:MAG: nucleotidyltransferase family protein [Myxococcota bacterium]
MIGATVLAAGASRRLGVPKQLLKVNGVTFVRHAAECALRGAERVAVVVGCHSSAVRNSLRGLDVELVENLFWSEGIASSIRLAVSWARIQQCEALLLLLSDQPYLQPQHLERLCARYRLHGTAVASAYASTVGAPALLPASCYDALSRLEGDQGASRILREMPRLERVEWPAGALDVDTELAAEAFRPA